MLLFLQSPLLGVHLSTAWSDGLESHDIIVTSLNIFFRKEHIHVFVVYKIKPVGVVQVPSSGSMWGTLPM